MEDRELWDLSDDELIRVIEVLDARGYDRVEPHTALEELFSADAFGRGAGRAGVCRGSRGISGADVQPG
jgi:hypothetical protein